MSYIHIIVLFEIFIFLIALYFIMKIHMKNSRISIEKDFIDIEKPEDKEKIEQDTTDENDHTEKEKPDQVETDNQEIEREENDQPDQKEDTTEFSE